MACYKCRESARYDGVNIADCVHELPATYAEFQEIILRLDRIERLLTNSCGASLEREGGK